MDLEGRKQVVERYLDDVRWSAGGDFGYCKCPGRALHENPNKSRDALVYINGKTVTLYCVHQSCSEMVAEINRAMRSAVSSLPGEVANKFSKAARSRWANVMQLVAETLGRQEEIYSRHWCGPDYLAHALSLEDSLLAFFELFLDQQDIIWIGEVHHSGNPYGIGHFRTVSAWMDVARYWPFTCTGIFRSAGTIFRSKDEVIRNDYHCVEFDHLDEDPKQNQLKSFALFRYLEETYGLKGKIAIDTGNKSIHHWVENDPEIFNDEFKIFLKGIGADPAGWRPYQPIRFPGVMRADTKRPQSLIIL